MLEEHTKKKIQNQLVEITKKFLIELDRHKSADKLNIKTDLGREAGVDSLGRVELFHRIELAFGILLPQELMIQGKCLNDFVICIIDAKPQKSIEFDAGLLTTQNQLADHNKTTITGGFLDVAEKYPDKTQVYLYIDSKLTSITYRDLLTNSLKVLSYLQCEGIQKGDTVAIMLPTCAEFFYTFLGVQLAGAIPVPIYPPLRPEMIEEYALREAKILENANVRILVTFSRAKKLSNMLGILIKSLKKVVNAKDILKHSGQGKILSVTADDYALIQYTSGSTSLPKGVLLSHYNLVSNIHAIKDAISFNSTDIGVSWLPLYHDMGLIGSWLNSLYHGVPIVIMSPLDFLVRPESWLWAIHNFRGTLSAAPNFAYELCIKKIPDERLEGLDLSSWRLSFNGAEAVRPQTLRDFTEKFAKYGLSENSMCPVYGLAENSVSLTVPTLGEKFKSDIIKKSSFETKQIAQPAALNEPHHEFVSCGKVINNHKMRVVNETGEKVNDRVIGSFQFTGPSQMIGYFNNEEATNNCTTSDGWIDSGDLAYIVNDEVYIVGRKKDLIIKAGRNFYPEEIEDIVSHIRGVRKGCIVAFGVLEESLGTERMIIIAESRVNNSQHKKTIEDEILKKVTIALGIAPDEVIIVAPKSVPKTSSGKLQRAKCKLLYQNNKLGKKRLPLVFQLSKIWLRTFGVRLNTLSKKLLSFIYTVYANINILLLILILFLSCLILPKKLNIRFAKKIVKAGFKLIFCNIKVDSNNIHHDGIIIANHQSYIDAVVLFTILPSDTRFIGKNALSKIPLLSYIFNKLGVIFVERDNAQQSLDDLDSIKEVLKNNNQRVMIFPEGTFTEKKGLIPFKLGAFNLAANTNTKITPIAIKNTRDILASHKWLMWPGIITINYLDSLSPIDDSWDSIVAIEKQARQALSNELNEPMLD
jgi:fatty-acyl-CoA synthase